MSFFGLARRIEVREVQYLRVFCRECGYSHSPGTQHCPSFHRWFGRTVEPGLPVARVVKDARPR